MNTGQIISGAGHLGLLGWVLVAGFFQTPNTMPEVAVTSVSLLSVTEYEKLAAEAAGAPQATPPRRRPGPPAPAAPPEPEPMPEPEPLEGPDPPLPDPVEAPEPLAPPAEVDQPLPVPDAEAKPQDAPRVAPLPAEAPPPDAEVAETPTPSVSPDAAPEAPVVTEDQPEAAPEAATTQIITEAVETDDKPSLAPASSTRPRSKPAPEPARETPVETATSEPAEPDAPTEPAEDSVADAIAAALAEPDTPATEPPGTGGTEADAGPPMTDGEKDSLRVAVQACWNVGSLSSDALLTTVTVAVSMGQDGVPDAASIRMIGFQGGTDASARQAYEAARRAIIRCGARGFPLPPEKYEQWRNIEMEFNPERMRIK
jgi:hypothetical protein